MKYQEQELLDALAVDFILGAMKGAARKRFQRLMMANPRARQTVWRWERHLNPLAESLPATAPDKAVWQRIQQRLGWVATVATLKPVRTAKYWLALATAAVEDDRGHDYELWMLPANGQAPISLGLLPRQGERALDWPAAADGIAIAALAVSLEPPGGSTTGGPSGPVLFTAEIVTL